MQSEKPRAETDEDLAQIVIRHGPCTYLLLSLFMLVIIYPYCKDAGAAGKIILSGLFSVILLGGAYVTRRSRGSLIVGTVLSLISAILHWFALTTQFSIFFRILSVIYIIFLTYTIGSVLRYLLVKGPITADKLHGALAGFIMLAFVWTFIFALLESFAPGSFKIVPVDGAEPNSFYPLLYFSFTTLTTVGFGDIVPVTDQAMSLVIVEQLIGVFFVAVLIARLAGLYPPHTK
jgi:Ion channel